MSKDDNESQRTSDEKPGLVWIVVLAVLPLLYLLSVGPAIVMGNRHPETIEHLRKFYRPIGWLHEHTPLREPLEWWVELWEK
jgi:hypothetical protein